MRQVTVATTFVLLTGSLLGSALPALADGGSKRADLGMANVRATPEAPGHALHGKPWTEQEALQPLSAIHGFDAIPAPVVELAPQDNEFYLAEDDVLGHGNGPKPLRFAVPVRVGLDIADGEWMQVEGGRVWRVVLSSPNATTARLHLTGLRVPAGQEVRMSSPGWDGSVVGPIEGVGEFGNGEAWSMSMPTNEAMIEWFVPTGAPAKELPFSGVEYYHGYREIWKFDGPGDGGVAAAGTCHLDPICFPTWANESNGTVRLIFSGFLCSGQLTATTAADETPYVATANHCISTTADANACQFNFFYRRNTCAASATASAGTNVTGSDLSSTYAASDCTLLMIRPTLPAGVYWVGWTGANVPTNTASTGLHHPAGDYQRISFGTKNAAAFNCGSPTTNWSSLSWNPATQYGVTSTGVTEGGSSGSAIYRNSDKLMYGVLTCGASACNNTAADDGYGRWDVAVSSGGFGTLLAAGADDALEQNDSCAAAVAVTAGTSYANLVVKRLDEDWYILPVPSGGTVNMNLTFTHANGDVDAQVFSTCGGTLLADRNANTNNEIFSVTNSTASSTLLMRVYLGADTRNNYTMSFTTSIPAPSNDSCLTAPNVLAGTYAFSTAGATDGAPTITASCSDGAMTVINKDVWWLYTATCNGQATATTCGASFDTSIVVYAAGAGCPTASTPVVACNNNGTGCGTSSTAQWNVTSGSSWFIRVGSPTNQSGTGSLVLSCAVLCPEDLDGNGTVDGADLASLLGAWGTADPAADIDDNGTVDGADLASLLGAWGPC